MTKTSRRQIQFVEEVRRSLAKIFLTEIRPESNYIISINKVIASPDLKLMKIFISDINDNDDIIFGKFLELSKKKIRFLLAKNLKCRSVPEIMFIIDKSVKMMDNVMQLIKNNEISED